MTDSYDPVMTVGELQTVIVAALQHAQKTGLPFREPEKAGSAHLTESGRFQSDKYKWCAAGFVPIKTSDPMAQDLLRIYAERRAAVDEQFCAELLSVLAKTQQAPAVRAAGNSERGE